MALLFAVNNLQRDSTLRYTHISSVNKANPGKIWTTIWIFWISMAQIKAYFPSIRPQNNKKDSKIDPSLRRRLIIRENNHARTHARTHARNKRFQLPLIPTANQILWHCSNNQSLISVAAKIWPQWAQTCESLNQAQLLAVAVRENVWEPR